MKNKKQPTITVTESHLGPTGQQRYHVVVKRGSFVQGWNDLSADEAAEIASNLNQLYAERERTN